MTRLNTEVNELLKTVASKDEGLALALRMIFVNQEEEKQRQAARHEDNIKELARLQTVMTSAFVDGDIEGHKLYHQAIVARMVLINQVMREVLVALAKGGFLGLAGWLLYKLFQWKLPL